MYIAEYALDKDISIIVSRCCLQSESIFELKVYQITPLLILQYCNIKWKKINEKKCIACSNNVMLLWLRW